MMPVHDLLVFAGASLLLVLTPGPNMLYLISRSLCQGRAAGVISLAGVVLGFFVHMLAASLGITALFMAVPLAFEVLKWAGAAYLLWMAWQAVRPGGASPFDRGCVETQKLHQHLGQRIDRFPAFPGVEDFPRQERSPPPKRPFKAL